MSQKVRSAILTNWGLVILLTILAIIAITSIKPNHFLAGWDNFSVSLNNSINLPRTLFSTWREYRGLGVASDSEVTDLSRQILFAIIDTATSKELLNQTYTLAALFLGVLGIYYLSRSLLKDLKKPKFVTETASTIAALFYLFNLYTLSTFYFPMPMYVTRYAFVPWITLAFLNLLRKTNRRNLFLFILVSILGTPSYLTATVFITILILLFLITLTHTTIIKKGLGILSIFILANSFWLLPFTNYTAQKSKLLTTSSTFIEVNEIQLNEAPAHFEWKKILTFYPNFFYTKAQNLPDETPINLHEIIERLETSKANNYSLFIFPFVMLLGSAIAIFKYKNPTTRWIPITILLSLFALRKEYPPAGFIYDLLDNYIPLFKVIFRFSDTKFYPLLAVAGASASAITITYLLSLTSKIKALLKPTASVLIIILIATFSNTFSYYFKGKLHSPLMYNQIPPAYQQIANHINSDPDYSRVMHLPIESTSYWKPYSWGYVGSSFLAFMLDKPLFDRTFEPASLENYHVDTKLLSLAQNATQIQSQNTLNQKALELYNLLNITNTKYIIYDQTITPYLTSRNKKYWGEFPSEELQILLKSMTRQGLTNLISTHTTPNPNQQIFLYQINLNTLKKDIKVASNIHSNILNTPLAQENQNTYIQNSNFQGVLYPMHIPQSTYTDNKTTYTTNITNPPANPTIRTAKPNEVAIQVYANTASDKSIKLTLIPQFLPIAASTQNTISVDIPKNLLTKSDASYKLSDLASDWHILDFKQTGQYRLAISGNILPLPLAPSNQAYLGTVLSNPNTIDISLLENDGQNILDMAKFSLTEDPNCYKDKSEEYSHTLNTTASSLTLTTTNGTTCITQPFQAPFGSSYLETHINFKSNYQTLTNPGTIESPSKLQRLIQNEVESLPSANYFSYCLIDTNINTCLNNHRAIKRGLNKAVITSTQLTSGTTQILLSLPTIGTQNNSLEITNINIHSFKEIFNTVVNIPTLQYNPPINSNNNLQITVPKTFSSYSFYFNPATDAFKVYNKPCDQQDQARYSKLTNNLAIQYTHECQTGAYIELPFKSNNFYLWTTNYNLLSGKHPKFILKDDTFTYKDEYLSFYQGYPEIPFQKSLQKAQPILANSSQLSSQIQDKLTNPTLTSTNTFLHPQPSLNDNSSKLFTIFQQSNNQGILALKDMQITHLPSHWSSLSLDPNTNLQATIINHTPQKVIPSMWKTHINSQANAQDQLLIPFSQGYDKQWSVYKTSNPISALLGIGKLNTTQVKVNGVTNGWIVNKEDVEDSTIFFLYTPERLAVIGWLISLTTLAVVLIKLKKTKN